jgi:outer membrane receptor protein involved in Fe transport
MFVQDNWKTNRATVTAAIRYDWFKTGFPAQSLGAGSALDTVTGQDSDLTGALADRALRVG